jgi:hypothetical protein
MLVRKPRSKNNVGGNEYRKRQASKALQGKSGIYIKPSHEGELHENLHVPEGQKIPVSRLEEAKHSKSPAIRRRANFAINARHFRH